MTMRMLTELTPESWVTLSVGIATIATQLILVVVVFWLGKAQGRAQTRHDKAAETIVSALNFTKQLASASYAWASHHKQNAAELEVRVQITLLRAQFTNLVENNSPWLEPRTEGKVHAITNDLRKYIDERIEPLKSGNEAQAKESGDKLLEWSRHTLIRMQQDLENEARRIIGTKRHWTLEWLGRLIPAVVIILILSAALLLIGGMISIALAMFAGGVGLAVGRFTPQELRSASG